MTNQEAARLIAVCRAMWPKHPITDPDALVKGWELALSDVSYADGEMALREYLQTGTFFPAPAEIRAIVKATQPALDTGLYREYQRLRKAMQTDQLSGDDDRALDLVERRLGIGKIGHRSDVAVVR